MRIHTVKAGETLYGIAREYGVPPSTVIDNNGLRTPDRLTVGQELLILTPTRTYTVKSGDTLEKICCRFGRDKKSLQKSNPCLWEKDGVTPGQLLALKYDIPSISDLAVHGYFYHGCPISRLKALLPYLNYLTVSCSVSEDGRLRRLTDEKVPLNNARAAGVKALFRIYDRAPFAELVGRGAEYAKAVAGLVKEADYDGITLALPEAEGHQSYGELLELFKASAGEEGLLLFAEVDGNKAYTPTHAADGYIFSYEKCHPEKIPSFADGELQAYSEYAKRQDAQYSFIDLCALANTHRGALPYSHAVEEAVRDERRIEYDGEAMTCRFDRGKRLGGGSVVFPSLKNTKARLELCSKLGFGGISIDIMRVPTATVMMLGVGTVSPRCNPLP